MQTMQGIMVFTHCLLTFLPARLLCKFMSARASLSFLSLASTKPWLKRMACSTWSLQPPQSKEPLASRDEPFFVGSQEQESSSPWLQARMAYMKATSRLPGWERMKRCEQGSTHLCKSNTKVLSLIDLGSGVSQH
uniref:Secreted protein n=1 Tax=Sander lucioperca TaxID=283035 RepID=A0A8D0D353_SANLU